MNFQPTMVAHFPGAVTEARYVDLTRNALNTLGFSADNTLACVGTCRDELCRPLRQSFNQAWGQVFNFSGLGGLLFAGRTGFSAALQHAPLNAGRARMLYLAMPHIAIDGAGTIGSCVRAGRPGPGQACGALEAFRAELELGRLSLSLDPHDLEQSLLKHRLLEGLAHNRLPSLLEITYAAHEVIRDELRWMVEHTVDRATTDWAVLTGVQIHGPMGDWVWPGESYSVIGGVERPLTLE